MKFIVKQISALVSLSEIGSKALFVFVDSSVEIAGDPYVKNGSSLIRNNVYISTLGHLLKIITQIPEFRCAPSGMTASVFVSAYKTFVIPVYEKRRIPESSSLKVSSGFTKIPLAGRLNYPVFCQEEPITFPYADS